MWLARSGADFYGQLVLLLYEIFYLCLPQLFCNMSIALEPILVFKTITILNWSYIFFKEKEIKIGLYIHGHSNWFMGSVCIEVSLVSNLF